MRLLSYGSDRKAGVLHQGAVYDAAQLLGTKDSIGVLDLLRAGNSVLDRLALGLKSDGIQSLGQLEEMVVGPPIPQPSKILCVGLNYSDHIREANLRAPRRPDIFAKYGNTLIGDGAAIPLPALTNFVDYEGELAVVIGKTTKGVSADSARSHVAGLTIFNDVTARDVQQATSQWTMGKSFDGFGPCGPVLVTMDEFGDEEPALDITVTVNGEIRQQSNTANLLFGVSELVTYISGILTLEIGDIISTGTPAGVGYHRKPPIGLKNGDQVCINVERIGSLCNPVRRQSDLPVSSSNQ